MVLIGGARAGQPRRLQPVQRLAAKDKSAAAGVGLAVRWLPAGVPGICKAAKRPPGAAPGWRVLLCFQEQIKGPENAPIARFDGLGCY